MKKIFSALLILSISFFSIAFANTMNKNVKGFVSPLASTSLKQTGSISTKCSVEGLAKQIKENQSIIVASRSMGCSTGCSMGCSTGCSVGCSTGCSVGCGGW